MIVKTSDPCAQTTPKAAACSPELLKTSSGHGYTNRDRDRNLLIANRNLHSLHRNTSTTSILARDIVMKLRSISSIGNLRLEVQVHRCETRDGTLIRRSHAVLIDTKRPINRYIPSHLPRIDARELHDSRLSKDDRDSFQCLGLGAALSCRV